MWWSNWVGNWRCLAVILKVVGKVGRYLDEPRCEIGSDGESGWVIGGSLVSYWKWRAKWVGNWMCLGVKLVMVVKVGV
jgi:hypothetical protein